MSVVSKPYAAIGRLLSESRNTSTKLIAVNAATTRQRRLPRRPSRRITQNAARIVSTMPSNAIIAVVSFAERRREYDCVQASGTLRNSRYAAASSPLTATWMRYVASFAAHPVRSQVNVQSRRCGRSSRRDSMNVSAAGCRPKARASSDSASRRAAASSSVAPAVASGIRCAKPVTSPSGDTSTRTSSLSSGRKKRCDHDHSRTSRLAIISPRRSRPSSRSRYTFASTS